MKKFSIKILYSCLCFCEFLPLVGIREINNAYVIGKMYNWDEEYKISKEKPFYEKNKDNNMIGIMYTWDKDEKEKTISKINTIIKINI